jgi:hypothetical protein
MLDSFKILLILGRQTFNKNQSLDGNINCEL